MPTRPKCQDCQTEMEGGFIPDKGDANICTETTWHPWPVLETRLFGFVFKRVKVDKHKTRRIIAYRCPNCGLIKMYA